VKGPIGVSVGAATVRAVLLDEGRIGWAGAAPYASLAELSEAIARLAGEAGKSVRRARVVLERDLVQVRTIRPAPPLPPKAWRRYVALETARLFRQNGAPLVTEGIRVPGPALLAAAAPEPILRSVIDACRQVGLAIESLGPATLVLPFALRMSPSDGDLPFPNGTSTEVIMLVAGVVVQSRRIPGAGATPLEWAAPLLALDAEASHFAPAYAAACAGPYLELWPADVSAGRAREVRRRLLRLGGIAASLWLLAGGVWVSRLALKERQATRALATLTPSLDSALAVRREIDVGTATLATIVAARAHRSRLLQLLTKVAEALGDSAYLVAVRVDQGGTVRLSGFAPSATRVVAALGRLPDLQEVQLEGAITRETGEGNRELERFNLVARVTR